MKWRFAEVPGEHDVVVREVVEDQRIVFEWAAEGGGYNTRVEMAFKPLDEQNTMVQISESGWREEPAGIKASYGNAGGWMHMMCSLKAYLGTASTCGPAGPADPPWLGPGWTTRCRVRWPLSPWWTFAKIVR